MMFINLKSYLVQIKLRQKIVNLLIDNVLNNELKKNKMYRVQKL
jgi:hypothetical protein